MATLTKRTSLSIFKKRDKCDITCYQNSAKISPDFFGSDKKWEKA